MLYAAIPVAQQAMGCVTHMQGWYHHGDGEVCMLLASVRRRSAVACKVSMWSSRLCSRPVWRSRGGALWDRHRALAAIAWVSAAPWAGWQAVLCCGTVLVQQEQGCCVAVGQAAGVAGLAVECLAAAMPLRVVSSWNVVHSNVLCGGEVGQDLQHL